MLSKIVWGLSFAFCLLSITLSGCGGGGGGGTAADPNLQSSLMTFDLPYDFGFVTLSNSPAAKEIILSNNGNASLEVSSIELTGAEFVLDLDSEPSFCGSTAPTINAGGSCSVAVGFQPLSEGNHDGTLTISSNDPDSPTLVIRLTGTGLAIAEQIVRINQVEPDTCASSELTAYVSVTDQVGFPISDLPLPSFTLSETFNGSTVPMTVKSLDFVANVVAPISVVLVMDYSKSITSDPGVVAAMEDGVISFLNQLGANDEAEIVKFDSEFEVAQPFTAGDAAGKAALIAKVKEPWDMGDFTRVYDAAYRAVTDAALRPTERRAVIILSDGYDDDGTDTQLSDKTLQDVIDQADASGVPIFTIGIGAALKETILSKLSSASGGQYFNAPRADYLDTIYEQQAEILFVDQYVLTYDSVFEAGESAILTVGVDLDEQGPNEPVYDSRLIVPCP